MGPVVFAGDLIYNRTEAESDEAMARGILRPLGKQDKWL